MEKIKIFSSDAFNSKLEENINEFIKDKKIIRVIQSQSQISSAGEDK